MSGASNRAADSAESRMERLQSWIAATASALLHLFFVFLLLYAARPTFAPPQGASSSGGRTRVQFIGEPRPADAGPITPPAGTDATGKRPRPQAKAKPRRATTAVNSPPLADAPYAVSPDATPETSATPAEASSPDEAAAGRQSRQPATSPPSQRRSATWGQPPGLLPKETSPENRGTDRGMARNSTYRSGAAAGEPNMQAGGYQIIYDVLSEVRLGQWRDQGMKELSFPLPGLREYMVCPLEIVWRRGSGGCRLLDPSDPEMQRIGDAREVVIVVRVYRRGELVWRGPGPYR